MEKTTNALMPPPSSSPGIPCSVSGEKRFEQHAHALLRLPRRAQAVVDVGDGEARFVAHGELSDHRGGIRELRLELIFRAAQRLAEKLVEICLGLCRAAHQREKAVEILRHIPRVGVAVVLVVVVAAAHAAVELRIERLDPLAVWHPSATSVPCLRETGSCSSRRAAERASHPPAC